MEDQEFRDVTEAFEKAVAEGEEGKKYVLRLYVAGMTPRSSRAIEAIKKLCESELKGRYDLEVIDIYQQPTEVQKEQLLAVPTLIRKLPLPLRRIIGDMTNTERVLVALDLHPKE